MLKQRVITALLLLAVLIPALLNADTRFFSGLSLLMICAGAWEWGRLNGQSQFVSLTGAAMFLIFALMAIGQGWGGPGSEGLWSLAGGAWVLLGVWMLRVGVAGWGNLPAPVRWLTGLWMLVLSWLALHQAHLRGVNFLLSVLVLVWAADVFAYFAGRALGGRCFARKLAPAISPGKTWEGVLGGLAGVLLIAGLWIVWDRGHPQDGSSLHTLLWQQGTVVAVVGWAFLTAMSVVGDLPESLVKRSAGVKDSSGLLPGHGGVLDRVDALLPTLPLAMMLLTWLERQA
jgi:phosphatidate cytidylyltransferase